MAPWARIELATYPLGVSKPLDTHPLIKVNNPLQINNLSFTIATRNIPIFIEKVAIW